MKAQKEQKARKHVETDDELLSKLSTLLPPMISDKLFAGETLKGIQEVASEIAAHIDNCQFESRMEGESFTIYQNGTAVLEIKYLSDALTSTIFDAFRALYSQALGMAEEVANDVLDGPDVKQKALRLVLEFRERLTEENVPLKAPGNEIKISPEYFSAHVAAMVQYVRGRLPEALEDLLYQLTQEAILARFKQDQLLFKSRVKEIDSLQRDSLRRRLQAPGRGAPKFYKDITQDQQRSLSIAYDSASKHFSTAASLYSDDDVSGAMRYLAKIYYAGKEHNLEGWLIADFQRRESSDSHSYRLAHYLAAQLVGLPIRHSTGESREGDLVSVDTIEEQRKLGDGLRPIKRRD